MAPKLTGFPGTFAIQTATCLKALADICFVLFFVACRLLQAILEFDEFFLSLPSLALSLSTTSLSPSLLSGRLPSSSKRTPSVSSLSLNSKMAPL